jgi:hypothetical protein
VKPGVNTDHILAAGKLIIGRKPDVVVVGGDFWDMESLSTHTPAQKIGYEHQSYMKDYKSGVDAMELLLGPMKEYNARQRRNKKAPYRPRLVQVTGNHCYRVDRLLEQNTVLAGALPRVEHYLLSQGFEVYPYKIPVKIDGITYCHLCPQTKSAGAVERAHLIMQKRNASWTVGHSQMLDYFVSPHEPRLQCIIAGAFYTHDEGYKVGSNDHWRGLVYKTNVVDGTYDAEFISIDGLLERY